MSLIVDNFFPEYNTAAITTGYACSMQGYKCKKDELRNDPAFGWKKTIFAFYDVGWTSATILEFSNLRAYTERFDQVYFETAHYGKVPGWFAMTNIDRTTGLRAGQMSLPTEGYYYHTNAERTHGTWLQLYADHPPHDIAVAFDELYRNATKRGRAGHFGIPKDYNRTRGKHDDDDRDNDKSKRELGGGGAMTDVDDGNAFIDFWNTPLDPEDHHHAAGVAVHPHIFHPRSSPTDGFPWDNNNGSGNVSVTLPPSSDTSLNDAMYDPLWEKHDRKYKTHKSLACRIKEWIQHSWNMIWTDNYEG